MIYLSASICWPFKHDPEFYGDYFYKDWKISKHKHLEIQAVKGSDEIIGFGVRSWRYAAVVKNGVIEKLFVEPGAEDNCPTDPYGETSPQNVLKWLQENA